MERARAQLQKMLELLGIEGTIETGESDENALELRVESPDGAILIGKDGHSLDALQYILNRILFQQDREIARCTVDVNSYRGQRKDKMIDDAFAAAEKAVKNQRPVMLAPMNSAERRMVHQALKENTAIRTWSEETDIPGIKRVVIEPA